MRTNQTGPVSPLRSYRSEGQGLLFAEGDRLPMGPASPNACMTSPIYPHSLLVPHQRRVHRQVKKRHRVGQGLVHDCSLDVRSQRRQVDHPTDIAVVNVFGLCDGREIGGLAALDLAEPPMPWEASSQICEAPK